MRTPQIRREWVPLVIGLLVFGLMTRRLKRLGR